MRKKKKQRDSGTYTATVKVRSEHHRLVCAHLRVAALVVRKTRVSVDTLDHRCETSQVGKLAAVETVRGHLRCRGTRKKGEKKMLQFGSAFCVFWAVRRQ